MKWMSGLYWKTIGRRESVAEQLAADVGPRAGKATDARSTDRRLAGHADLDVGRAVARVDRREPREEDVAELLGHALAADERMELVVGPREAAPLALVEEVLEERRIAGDQEAVASARGTSASRGSCRGPGRST